MWQANVARHQAEHDQAESRTIEAKVHPGEHAGRCKSAKRLRVNEGPVQVKQHPAEPCEAKHSNI